jgi:hypothetical protein
MFATLAFICVAAPPNSAAATVTAPAPTPMPPPPDPAVPLTPESYEAIGIRVAFERAAGRALDVVQRFDSDFGSAWFDREDAIVVPTLPTATADEKAQIVAAAPPGAIVRFSPATYSSRQLRAWSDQLETQWTAFTDAQRAHTALPSASVFTDLAALNLEVASAGPQDDVNRLRIGLVSLPADSTETVRQTWQRAADAGYAPPVDAVIFQSQGRPQVTDSRGDSPGQLKSGLNVNGCTSNLSVTGSGGVIYQLSAGHCFRYTGSGITVTHAGQTIGYVSATNFYDNTDNDAAMIRLTPGGLGSPYAFAQSSSSIQADTISSYRATNNIAVGNAVCMGGVATTVIVCGTVTAVHQPIYYGAPYYVHVRDTFFTSYKAAIGDSGALNAYGSEAFGIQSGTTFDGSGNPVPPGIVSPIGNALAAFGVVLMTTSPGVPADWATIRGRFADKCADVAYNSSANGTIIWSWTCNGNPAQQWSFVPVGTTGTSIIYAIKRFALSSKCMDVDGGGLGNGVKVQEWDCNGQSQQQWRLVRVGSNRSDFNIVSMRSGKCLDLDISQPGGGYSDGTRLQQWSCLGANQTNQLWRIG